MLVLSRFWFCSKFSFGCFLREQHLSNNLSILLKKSLHFQRESEEPYSSQCFLYLFQKPLGQNCNIVGRGVPTPYFMRTPLYCLPLPFFKFSDTPFLKTTPSPLIYQSSLWEKSDAPFFQKFQKLTPLHFIGGVSNYGWNVFSFILHGWTPASCPWTSRNAVRWSINWVCYISWDNIVGGIIIEYIIVVYKWGVLKHFFPRDIFWSEVIETF